MCKAHFLRCESCHDPSYSRFTFCSRIIEGEQVCGDCDIVFDKVSPERLPYYCKEGKHRLHRWKVSFKRGARRASRTIRGMFTRNRRPQEGTSAFSTSQPVRSRIAEAFKGHRQVRNQTEPRGSERPWYKAMPVLSADRDQESDSEASSADITLGNDNRPLLARKTRPRDTLDLKLPIQKHSPRNASPDTVWSQDSIPRGVGWTPTRPQRPPPPHGFVPVTNLDPQGSMPRNVVEPPIRPPFPPSFVPDTVWSQDSLPRTADEETIMLLRPTPPARNPARHNSTRERRAAQLPRPPPRPQSWAPEASRSVPRGPMGFI